MEAVVPSSATNFRCSLTSISPFISLVLTSYNDRIFLYHSSLHPPFSGDVKMITSATTELLYARHDFWPYSLIQGSTFYIILYSQISSVAVQQPASPFPVYFSPPDRLDRQYFIAPISTPRHISGVDRFAFFFFIRSLIIYIFSANVLRVILSLLIFLFVQLISNNRLYIHFSRFRTLQYSTYYVISTHDKPKRFSNWLFRVLTHF